MAAGAFDGNPLFASSAERRIMFAEAAFLSPTRTIDASRSPFPLTEAPRDFSQLSYAVDGELFNLGDFLHQYSLLGLIVLQHDQILLEHYAEDHGPDRLWNSFSVTKSISSMLIGAAIQEGYIGSLDDQLSDYLPALEGSAYSSVTIEQLLHMASGVAWNEDYTDPSSDVSRAGALNGDRLIHYLSRLEREHPPGAVFNYNTGETNLVGELLRAAVGGDAAGYLTERIWQPFGMESDAVWLLDESGGAETGGCCISATLRDYARLGLFALNDGVLRDGTRVLPRGWMEASTQPSPAEEDYGYQWWLDDAGRSFAAGIFGQRILIVPEKSLVLAAHSDAPEAVGSVYAKHLSAVMEMLATTSSRVMSPRIE